MGFRGVCHRVFVGFQMRFKALEGGGGVIGFQSGHFRAFQEGAEFFLCASMLSDYLNENFG